MQIKFLNRSVSSDQKFGKFLSSIYGISRATSIRICKQLGFDYSSPFGKISIEKLSYLEAYISNLNLGLDLQRVVQNRISDKIRRGGYTGLRISQNLPSRGQRSKTNAQTTKRKSRLLRSGNIKSKSVTKKIPSKPVKKKL